MSERTVDNFGCVSNVKIYGLKESIKRAKYSMSTDTNVSASLTNAIQAIAQSPAGSGEDQWLTGVVVQFDLRFSIKAWTEAERYHFFDFVSSQSTMHRITKFDLDTAYNAYVDKRIIDIMKSHVERYNFISESLRTKSFSDRTSEEQMKAAMKEEYLKILYSNPTGFMLTAGMTTNYRQLKTIYRQRKSHRLPEWREFCAWIETLPHSGLITDSHRW